MLCEIDNTIVYVVLAILAIAFLFFIGNTIRCYLSRPKYIDEEDYLEEETEKV